MAWRKLQEAKDEPVADQEFFKSLLNEHRHAVQLILNSTSEKALDAIMQQTISFQQKALEKSGEAKLPGAAAPQLLGLASNEARDVNEKAALLSGRNRGSVVRFSADGDEQKDQKHSSKVGIEPDNMSDKSNGANDFNVKFREEERLSIAAVSRYSKRKSNFRGRRSTKLRKDISSDNQVIEEDLKQKAGVFADAEAIKQKLRREIAKPNYNVADLYHSDGYCQALAKSTCFENFTLVVIAFNAIWISVDIDHNDAAILSDADVGFIVVDNLFCIYFLFEWLVRFGSFKNKRDGLKDAWFVFDSFMCALMVTETWILPLIFAIFSTGGGEGLGDASLLKGFRLVRLVRMARVIRVLNALPELMIVIKGMAVATRAVACTCALMLLIIYVFAVAFRQLTDDTVLGSKHFGTVPTTMRFLLLHGTMADVAAVTLDIWNHGVFYAIMFLGFILMVTITIMNMLVGVLVGVVNTVASVEKEQLTVNFVKENLLGVLRRVKDTTNAHVQQEISREDFGKLLGLPEAIRAFKLMDVDVIGLVDLADFIFQDGKPLPFGEFMELTMQLRGSNQATVKDIVDLRKFLVLEFQHHLGGLNANRSEPGSVSESAPVSNAGNVFARSFTKAITTVDEEVDTSAEHDEFAAKGASENETTTDVGMPFGFTMSKGAKKKFKGQKTKVQTADASASV